MLHNKKDCLWRSENNSECLKLPQKWCGNFNFENFASQKFSLIYCDFSFYYEIAFLTVRKLMLSSLLKIKECLKFASKNTAANFNFENSLRRNSRIFTAIFTSLQNLKRNKRIFCKQCPQKIRVPIRSENHLRFFALFQPFRQFLRGESQVLGDLVRRT